MLKLVLTAIAMASLSGCATRVEQKAPELQAEPTPFTRAPVDVQKINTLERQLADKQRQCLVDKRRMEVALKDSQKQVDELQKKLDVLLAIDRELRSTKKVR